MRIALMLRHLEDRGGTGEYTRRLVEALLDLDREDEFLLLLASEAAAARYRGIPHARCLVLPGGGRLGWDQWRVPRLLRQERPDVVMNLKHALPLWGPGRQVFVMHGADWIAFPANYPLADRLYHRLALPLYLRRADRVITVSADAARRIAARAPAAEAKLAMVHHGVGPEFARVLDPARLAAVRARYGLPERFLLYVGQIYPMKNVGGILQAFARLRERIPHALVLAGKRAVNAEADLRLMAELGLEDRVVETGWVEAADLPALYSLADLFVFPSLYEGFGLPLLEAMACGCPVVTSTAGSCPEVAGDAALLVDPRDPAAIAGAVQLLLDDPGLRAELVARGLERVPRFTWAAAAARTLAVLRAAAATVAAQADVPA
jgi:glycosyltransferase involved in cell wall biosynthesis